MLLTFLIAVYILLGCWMAFSFINVQPWVRAAAPLFWLPLLLVMIWAAYTKNPIYRKIIR